MHHDQWVVLGTMGGKRENEHNLHTEKLSFKLEAAGGFYWDRRKCHK